MTSQTLVVIPTYNEAENISRLIEEIFKLNEDLEVLVVDDNSQDGTGKLVKNLQKKYRKLHLIIRPEKLGIGTAYVTGFKWGLEKGFDFFVSMDADFSHSPEDLKKLLAAPKKYDLVLGSRYVPGGKIIGWQLNRFLLSRFANIVCRLMLGLTPHDVSGGFRRYSKRFLKNIDLDNLVSYGYAFQAEMVFLGKTHHMRMVEVPITFHDRRAGQSKIAGEAKKSIKAIFRLALRRRGLRQLVKFSIVGTINFILDWTIYLTLTRFLGVYYVLAKALSFVAGATSSFIFNRRWTFRSTNPRRFRQLVKFLFVAVVGLGLNTMILYIAVEYFKLHDIIGLLFATAMVTFWNFFVNKYWTFKF